MDYLESLKVFRAVVEAKSFTRAADVLGMSPPAVSRSIAALEQRLGNRLFHRTTRHISLTETAEQFYVGCERVLDELDALEAQASNGASEPTGVLRIVAHTSIAVGRLVPLISSFRRKFPLVGLDVTLSERPVDLVADGFDLAIVLPFMLTSDTTITRLLERMQVVIVGIPEYLATHSKLEHPSALVEHEFIAMHASIRKPELTFLIDSKRLSVPVRTDMTSNNAVLNMGLVMEGFGLGVLPAALVRDELASGRLVSVLEGFPLIDGSIETRLAYSSRTLLPAKVRAFIEHASSFFTQEH
jgi:DNA-binding transcriptional LysR family regulator